MINLVARIFMYVVRAAELLILIRCILSWIPGINNQFTSAVYRVTEFILAPIRNVLMRFFDTRTVMIDFSPIVALLLISLIERLFFRLLFIIR